MEISKIYEYALQREHEGKRFFEENANRLSHAVAAGAFQRLASEEQMHIEFLEVLLSALECGEEATASAALEAHTEDLFTLRADSEMLDQTVIEAMVPDLPVLRMAYLIERDFAEFYERAAESVEGQAREVLTMLARWERGHERLFKHMHDRTFEEYAQMPWGG